MKQIFADCVPLVKAGDDVTIDVDQTLGQDLLHIDGPNRVHVRIDGPQTALLADMIAGVYPAPGSENSPDEFLPHIALTRRTLPWERWGPGINPEKETPWLALLLFAEPELRSARQMVTAPKVSVVRKKVQDIAETVTRNRLINACKIPGTTEVSTLTISNSLLGQVMPTIPDLRLLCHLKRSTQDTDTGPDAEPVEVDNAIVVCNRLPNSSAPPGERPPLHLAVLVSVERATELFPPPATGSTTLLVLHHWTFRPTQGGDFEQVMKSIAYRPNGGVQRFGNLPAPVTMGESAPLSGGFKGLLDDDGYFLTGMQHDQDVNATYRGPLRPFGPQPRSSSFAIAAAPNEFAEAPQDKPIDFAHAAAFELGRLLALHDPAILEDLRDISGRLKPIDIPVAVNKLPPALQKPDWIVDPGWVSRPWESADVGQSLVKDRDALLDKGLGDITGVRDHLDKWNPTDVVTILTDVGAVVSTPVAAIDLATVDEQTLQAQFAEVAETGKG